MISEIASSSWDSIYATASGPAAVMVAGQKDRTSPAAGVKLAGTADLPPRRRNVVTDASLQVEHNGAAKAAESVPELAVPSPTSSADLTPPAPPKTNGHRGRFATMLSGMKHVLTGRFLRRRSA